MNATDFGYPFENDGVIEGRRDTDFAAGTLPYEERNPSGDWTPYLVRVEQQYSMNTDTKACVSYSANNALEIQIKFLTGQEVNLSDRWLAKMSDTTQQGNWLYKVADVLRKQGAVIDSEWPEPPNYTWDSYYAEIPQVMQERGLEFLKEWSVAYE